MRKMPVTASLLAHAAAIGGALLVGAAAPGGVPQVSWQARSEMVLGSEAAVVKQLAHPVVVPPVEVAATPEPVAIDPEPRLLDPHPWLAEDDVPGPVAGEDASPGPVGAVPKADWVRSLRPAPVVTPVPDPVEPELAAEAAPAASEAGGAVTADEVPPSPEEAGNQPPEYPLESRRRGEQGTVVIRLRIDAEGKVLAAEIASSSGHARLDRAALSALLRWVYRPAVRGGIRVAGQVDQQVVFRLDDG
jgi:periplasmic protein TonB